MSTAISNFDSALCRQLIDDLPHIVWIAERDGSVTFLNRAWVDVTGFSRDSGLGFGWLDKVHADDRDTVLEAWDRARRDEAVFTAEFRVVTSDGSFVYCAMRSRPVVSEDGPGIRWIGSVSEVTQLRRERDALEARSKVLEQVVEGTVAGYWDWRLHDDYQYTSPALKAMLGYEDSEVPNSPGWWREQMHPDDLPSALELFQKHVESKGVVPYSNEVRYFHKQGHAVWMHCRGKVIEWDDNGAPIRMVGSHADITYWKLIQQELVRTKKELAEFAYVAGHDMKEPLRMVSSYVSLLVADYRDKLDPDAEEFLQYVVDGANRLKGLIEDLVAYCRIGRITNFQPIDMNRCMQGVRDDLHVKMQESEAELSWEDLPTVDGDGSHLRGLLKHLVENALKYRREDPPKIHIGAEKQGRSFRFHVQDNGIGIESGYEERIFLPFKRLHGRDEHEGNGIGLAICKKVVELHGGKIWYESEPAQGTTFFFALPIRGTRTPST